MSESFGIEKKFDLFNIKIQNNINYNRNYEKLLKEKINE